MTSSLTLWLARVASRLAVVGLGTANLIVLARMLEPEGRGHYFLFLSLVTVLTVVADLGLSQSATVYSSDNGAPTDGVHRLLVRYGSCFSVATVALIGALLGGVGDRLLPNFPRQWVWLAFGIFPLALYANVWSGMMVGMRRLKELNVIQLIVGAASLALNVVFVAALGGGLRGALAVYVAVSFGQAAVMFVMARRLTSRPDEVFLDGELRREILSFGLRGYLGSLSTLLWTRSIVFLLNGFHGATAVGIFSVSQQLAEKMFLPGQALQDVIFQKVGTSSREAATAIVNRYSRTMLWSMVPVAVLGALLAPWLITGLLGPAYLPAANVFRILLFGVIVINPSLLLIPYFIGQLRRPGLVSVIAWLNVLTNLALAAVLIPPFAEIGAAIALLLTEIIGGGVIFAVYFKASKTHLRQAAWLRAEDVAVAVGQARRMLSAPHVE